MIFNNTLEQDSGDFCKIQKWTGIQYEPKIKNVVEYIEDFANTDGKMNIFLNYHMYIIWTAFVTMEMENLKNGKYTKTSRKCCRNNTL